ncbi:hypothetical protein E3J79_02400 [Candidatus Dependentiae bacterium]|nr:MAG: hypothetical protein E3J79_02400 [Candidatus Dependentiae bacterium]
MKKLLLLASLTAMFVIFHGFGAREDLNNEASEYDQKNSFSCYGSESCEACAHNKNIATIVKVLDKAIEVELGHIAEQMPKDTDLDHIDLVQLDRLIKQELGAITTKVAYAVQHDLTQEQRAIVINLLHNLKDLSGITTDDLLLMAERCLTYEWSCALIKAIKKHCPKELKERMENNCFGWTLSIFLDKEFEKVDLGDASFNALKNFMCKCSYLEDVDFGATVDIDNNQGILLQQCFNYVSCRIDAPSDIFDDFCFFPGWKDELKKTGDLFVIINTLCNQLLEAIDK